jgi:hypothetical protein
VCGKPKRDIQPDKKARATVSSVISGMGMASGHLVKRSTAVRQYIKPDEVGRGTMKSMWTCRKRPCEVSHWCDRMARDFRALTGLASSCPRTTISLDAWPQKTLCA